MCVCAVCNKMGDYDLKKETVSDSPSPSFRISLYIIPTTNPASSNEKLNDEKIHFCIMADNTQDESPSSQQLAFGGDEGRNVLRLITASSQCPFRTSDGVLLNVECFGPNYGGGDDNESLNGYSNAGGDSSMHKRSMHNSDEWPLVSLILSSTWSCSHQ